MQVLSVLIQHAKTSLDRVFTYLNPTPEKVVPGCRVLVRFNNQLLMAYVTAVGETELSMEEFSRVNGYAARPIERIVDTEPLLSQELMDLVDEVSDYYLCPRISVLQTMLPQSLKPSYSSLHGPKIAYEDWVELLDANEEGLTAKQKEIIRYLAQNSPILKKEAGSAAILKTLAGKGKIRFFKKEKVRYQIPENEKEREPKELSQDQLAAVKSIYESKKRVVLLQPSRAPLSRHHQAQRPRDSRLSGERSPHPQPGYRDPLVTGGLTGHESHVPGRAASSCALGSQPAAGERGGARQGGRGRALFLSL